MKKRPARHLQLITFFCFSEAKSNCVCCPIVVNEGDDVSCASQGQDGNPPAKVTWYKDSRKIGG